MSERRAGKQAVPEPNPFWEFSLSVWGGEGVEHACLGLQERHGLDVNLLLFCAFAGTRGRVLEAAELRRLIEAVRPWRESVVLPLRVVRRWLKIQEVAAVDAAEDLRAAVKRDELQAEAVQQRLLLEALPVAPGEASPTATVANLMSYFETLGSEPDAGDIAALATILRACHPDLPPLDAVWLLSV